MLENDGSLAINQTVDEFVRNSPPIEIAAYAPLKGLPEFLDLAVTLALGDAREELESIGVCHTATASPGFRCAILSSSELCRPWNEVYYSEIGIGGPKMDF